jgi:hypothetical protein
MGKQTKIQSDLQQKEVDMAQGILPPDRQLPSVIWAVIFGAIAFGLTFWIDVQSNDEIGNLTPPAAVVFASMAFCVGLLLAVLILRMRGLATWQTYVLLAGSAILLALVVLRLSSVWPRNDSIIIAHRIQDALLQISKGEQRSVSFTVSFRPPKRAGDYVILIAGSETPPEITDQPSERLWVQYPENCSWVTDHSSKPYLERTNAEKISPICGGLLWGSGWTFIPSYLMGTTVPVTLRVEKNAGESTEIIFRKRDLRIEMVELR